MNETTWRSTTTERIWMLEHVRALATHRQFRLFGCACLRRVGDRLSPEAQLAVERAERLAEGLTPWISTLQGMVPLTQLEGDGAAVHLARACLRVLDRDPRTAALAAVHVLAALAQDNWRDELAAQCDLIRCLFGNPFRPSRLDPAWLKHGQGTVRHLARVIRDEGRFADLPVLGDALEDAGCRDESVLEHCRQGRGHARGCWVIDLLMR
jgi:hypothetical protein